MKITRVGGRISRDRLPPRGATCPWLACPPGGNLSRGQDKLGHRHFANLVAKIAKALDLMVAVMAVDLAVTVKVMDLVGTTMVRDLMGFCVAAIVVAFEALVGITVDGDC